MPFLDPGLPLSELVSGKGWEGKEERSDQLKLSCWCALFAVNFCGAWLHRSARRELECTHDCRGPYLSISVLNASILSLQCNVPWFPLVRSLEQALLSLSSLVGPSQRIKSPLRACLFLCTLNAFLARQCPCQACCRLGEVHLSG
jgi:hypothetical protein